MNISLKMIEGELRIHDLLLAKNLGFEQPRDIRKLIKRHESNLLSFGVCATVERTPDKKGGRPATEFYLNQKQAIFICMKSETEKAFDVQIEIVRAFDQHLRNQEARSNFNALGQHLRKDVQIANSKAANRVKVLEGGRSSVVMYNTVNCIRQSGHHPTYWKTKGRNEGLPSTCYKSAKAVLRVQQPAVACGMSLSDQMVNGNIVEDTAISIGIDAQPLFARMLAAGFTPPELLC